MQLGGFYFFLKDDFIFLYNIQTAIPAMLKNEHREKGAG